MSEHVVSPSAPWVWLLGTRPAGLESLWAIPFSLWHCGFFQQLKLVRWPLSAPVSLAEISFHCRKHPS